LLEHLQSPSFKEGMDFISRHKKHLFLKKTLAEHVEHMKAKENDHLMKKAKQLKRAAVHLRDSLRSSQVAMTSFLSECDGLWLGTGSRGEYLLDVCSVSSADCIEEAYAEHVGCCCAYNPAAHLGRSSVTETIPGVSVELRRDGNFAVSPGGRLMASDLPKKKKKRFHPCAHAWETSLKAMAQMYYEQVRQTKNPQSILDHHLNLAARYGDDYCSPFPCNATDCSSENLFRFIHSQLPNVSTNPMQATTTVGLQNPPQENPPQENLLQINLPGIVEPVIVANVPTVMAQNSTNMISSNTTPEHMRASVFTGFGDRPAVMWIFLLSIVFSGIIIH